MTDGPQGQSQAQGKRSPVVAGLAAAAIAAALTATVMMSSGPSTDGATDQASSSKQCPMAPRRMLVSTETGTGTVQLRAGSYVSAPITLSATPQPVTFPLPRPDTTPVDETIMIEGTATNLVLTSDLTNFRRVFDNVIGVAPLQVSWAPRRNS